MKTNLAGCSAAALCLATYIHAFAAEGSSYLSTLEIHPKGDGRLVALDTVLPHEASQRHEQTVAFDKGVTKAAQHALQGLFCNSADQIDEAVTSMRKGMSPRAAVELVNREEVACTYVDLLRYIVDRPVVIDEMPGSLPLFKHKGTLVGVVVGDAVRPVTPPVQIFFAIPERLADVPFEGRA